MRQAAEADLTAVRGDVRQSLVLTAIPNANIMIQPIVDEAETIRCAHRARLDVPDVLFASENTEYVGGPFFISTRMDGETVPRKVLRLIAALVMEPPLQNGSVRTLPACTRSMRRTDQHRFLI